MCELCTLSMEYMKKTHYFYAKCLLVGAFTPIRIISQAYTRTHTYAIHTIDAFYSKMPISCVICSKFKEFNPTFYYFMYACLEE